MFTCAMLGHWALSLCFFLAKSGKQIKIWGGEGRDDRNEVEFILIF